MIYRSVIACVVVCGLQNAIFAASPSLGSIQPRGGQRATDVTLSFNGNNLSDTQEIIFYTPGFTVTKLEVVNNTQVKVTVKIAADAQLGEHLMRVRTASGISDMRTFWVGALPSVEEKEPNSDFASPQKIPLNVTVVGKIDNEDVDYFAVDAKKGQRISVEIEGMRLGDTLFDPYIAILDAKRFELATSDDTALLKQDGCLSIVAPADGTYIIQVRETSYGGNGACQYRLHVGTFPRPIAVVPAGGKLGEEVEVRFIGDAAGDIVQKIKLPTTMPANGMFGVFCQDAGGISPSAIPFRLSADATNVIEKEPNDTPAQATHGTLPCAFNGVIEKPGDIDHFKFSAKKGQVYDIHCYARRLGSQLDSVMNLAISGQGAFVGNDDAIGPDSFFRVTIPADGEYVLSVTDHLKKGGPSYFYRVEITAVQPRIDLGVPKVAQYSQERQSIVVPKGNRFATLISASRVDCSGDMTLGFEGLPGKMKFDAEAMPGFMTTTPVVFEAPADAAIGGTLATVQANLVDPKFQYRSTFQVQAEYVLGQPGQSIYVSANAPKAAVVVAEAVPFKINIVQPKVPLVHNGSMQLKIVAERQPGFKAPITIVPLYNPPGVGSATSVVIPEGQSEVYLPLNANGGAPARIWKYAVLGTATVGNGPVWVSSQLATIEIAPAFLGMTFERGAVDQGKETQLFVKVANLKPFTGTAKVKLIGLPAKVTTIDIDITKDSKEIAFPIKTEATSPAGIHRNLFCQVVILDQNEPITHSIGATELRIDVPLPPKKDQPMVVATQPMPMPKKDPTTPPKRLSRLEQLRLEQEEREKASKQPMGEPKKP